MEGFTGRDVAAKAFRFRRRGYDPAEVDAHLAEVAERVEGLRQQLAEAGRTERAAVLLLQKAQATADEMIVASAVVADQRRARAEAEAEDLLDAARVRADEIVRLADGRARAMLCDAEADLARLRQVADVTRRDLATTQASLARAVDCRATALRRQAARLLDLADEVALHRPDVEEAFVVSSDAPVTPDGGSTSRVQRLSAG